MFMRIRLPMVLGALILLPFLAVSAEADIILADVDHHWGFEDGTPGAVAGATTSDSIGSVVGTLKDGTNGGTFDLDFSSDSKVGNVAVDFFGGVVDISSLAGTYREDFSVAMWAKADTVGGGGYGRFMVDRPASGSQEGWLFNLNENFSGDGNSDTIGFGVGCTGLSNAYSDNDVFTLGTWQHVAFTFSDSYNASGVDTVEMNLYINGQPVGTATSQIPHSGSDFMGIGNNSGYNGTNNRAFDGRIDEVVIFNRKLSGAEVSEFYNTYGGSVSNVPVPEPASGLLWSVVMMLLVPCRRIVPSRTAHHRR